MASKDDLTAKFAEFATNKTKDQLTSKECMQFFHTWSANLKPKINKALEARMDSSVFSQCKEQHKTFMLVNKAKCEKYLQCTAKECVKIEKNVNLLKDEHTPMVKEQYDALIQFVLDSKGKSIAAAKSSKTGGVDRLTDASKYTGAHKERFTADGKGKGIEGREERHDHTGYTGQYKGQDTYDAKK